MSDQIFSVQAEPVQNRLPAFIGRRIGILLARFRDLRRGFFFGGMLEIRRFHLFGQQFLVNQPVENCSPIIFREFTERAAIQQGLIAQGVVPVTLQNNVSVHGGDNAVDHLPACATGKMLAHSIRKSERDAVIVFRANFTHQNGWPMLKNTLKCRKRWVSNVVGTWSPGRIRRLKIAGRIQIVSESQTAGARWCLISYAYSDRM